MNYPMIVKKDGRREPFNKEKTLRGLQAACQKRPVSLAQLEAVVEGIASWIVSRGEGEIPAELIGRKVMSELRKIDNVAYVRFASVYRNFKDIQEFMETLEDDQLHEVKENRSPQLSLSTFVEFPKGLE